MRWTGCACTYLARGGGHGQARMRHGREKVVGRARQGAEPAHADRWDGPHARAPSNKHGEKVKATTAGLEKKRTDAGQAVCAGCSQRADLRAVVQAAGAGHELDGVYTTAVPEVGEAHTQLRPRRRRCNVVEARQHPARAVPRTQRKSTLVLGLRNAAPRAIRPVRYLLACRWSSRAVRACTDQHASMSIHSQPSRTPSRSTAFAWQGPGSVLEVL